MDIRGNKRSRNQGRIRGKKFRSRKKLLSDESRAEGESSEPTNNHSDGNDEVMYVSEQSENENLDNFRDVEEMSQNNEAEERREEISVENEEFISDVDDYDRRREEISVESEEVISDDDDYDGDNLARYYYAVHGDTSDDSSNDEFGDDNLGNVEEEEHVPENPPSVVERLREWSLRLNQKDLDDLLKILRDLLPTLPKTAKTFLHTNDARYTIINMEDCKGKMGQFVYFKMQNNLEMCINPALHIDNFIELQVSCDGLPLHKSGDGQFWVVSGKVHFNPDVYKVFPICIFFGQAKPNSVEDFLAPFVEEFNRLNIDGIMIEGQHFGIKLKCIICDTPARSFLKRTLGHGGIQACERCEVVGERVERRTVYPTTDAVERTNESFRNFRQPEYHHGPSPLLDIIPHIDMVSIFMLDSMHLFFCGIMKKLMDYWLNGKLNCKLSVRSRAELSRRLEFLKTQIPIEFQRKTRSTSFFAKWKATELRFFLLYCGPIILKDLLPQNLYDHFLLLHVAARILHSDSFCRTYNDHAKLYLTSFFTAMKDYYGATSQILNAHHLTHVADDVITADCNLSLISAFSFENFLGKLKKKLRTPNKTLQQVCRRLFEEQTLVSKNKTTIPPPITILKTNKDGSIVQVKYKEMVISSLPPNNIVVLNNNKIVSIKKIFNDNENENLKVECQIWRKDKPLYTYPTNSEIFNIWKLNHLPMRDIKIYSIAAISQKVVKLQLSFTENGPQKVYVVPLLH
ncbi:uncharacterized protein LOC122507811 [Leptopilina heterotoma]|uniref:uncharacterized protein LOC122504295 n=1 Tax=Leptopilina heterotoma TaxID=63436 RepID=UPI001CA90551|nr:uncharacterized protein LOC122504295 [Leptopilina heterotoma]XP_043476668.1 uncharacterized protein LOC122507811 [Leptopilina heterotoma]